MKKDFEYRVLNLAGRVGELLLENGSEIYRVEESICKVAQKFGFAPQCFATLTCIIITLENSKYEPFSIMKRVKQRSTNLDKLYKISLLVDLSDKYTIEELERKLDEIEKEKEYSFILKLLGNCIGAAFFSILFLGGIHEFITSFIAGLLISLASKISEYLKQGQFFSNFLCGFTATMSVCLFEYFGYIEDISVPIISTLMLLVPGVAFINSIRDIVSGDLVTGTSRLLEVLSVGTAISIGSGLALNIYFKIGGV